MIIIEIFENFWTTKFSLNHLKFVGLSPIRSAAKISRQRAVDLFIDQSRVRAMKIIPQTQ